MLRVLKKTLKFIPKEKRGPLLGVLWRVKDSGLRLFILKCVGTYPEYREMIRYMRNRSKAEGKVRGYSEAYIRDYIEFRVDRTTEEIKTERRSILCLLEPKLARSKFKHVLETKEFKEFVKMVEDETSKEPW